MSRSRNSRRGSYPRDVVLAGDVKIGPDGKVLGYREVGGKRQKRRSKKAASRARRRLPMEDV